LTVTVQFTVTSVTPQSGSIFGGTTLTITGTGFPVGFDQVLSVNIGGKAWCLVDSMTATQVTCTIAQTTVPAYSGANLKVLVMLRIQLVADPCPTCTFSFLPTQVPLVIPGQT